MTTPVKLYVYDLSNGIARQLSLQLTGRQIDGIWHTSVVVFGKEIFYGQGISITQPGKSHHGSPLQTIDMGETQIDADTFDEFLDAMREQYTADKYHLLDFNCNSFTNDCLGFLTGGSLPAYIKSLPSDFLSTPFGAALRPTIDAMFTSRPGNSAPLVPRPALGASLLQPIMGGGPSTGVAPFARPAPAPAPVPLLAPAPSALAPTPAPVPAPATRPIPAADAPVVAPMHITTNPASFHNLLGSHRAVIAFFTSATCGPCRMIEPVFEELARSKSRPNGVGFTKIDLSVGMASAVAREYEVRATPTFIFFLDGRKTHELKGVNAPELKTQVDLLIYEAFPPHAHMLLSLPAVEAISLSPILFTQVPNLDTMFGKLAGFIDGVTSWNGTVTQAQVKQTLSKTVLPFLKAPAQQPKSTSFDHWLALTRSLAANLQPSELFPVVDIWRMALLNANFAAWNATKKVSEGGIACLMDKAVTSENVPRNYQLTVLRMLANAFSNQVLAREVILSLRQEMTRVVVDALLHDDGAVRTAGASTGFNIGGYLQRLRVEKRDDGPGAEENEEWEVELIVAILGAIEHEGNEETVHRLVASLGLMLRLSPYTEQMGALVESLGARGTLEGKTVTKKELQRLIREVATKLCP